MQKKILKLGLILSVLFYLLSCDLLPNNNADVTAPVITLVGNASVTINEGDVYTEQGATALDNIDGDISSDITISGSVNSEIPGSYERTYSVQDAAGNDATVLTRNITVVNVQEFSKWNAGTSQWETYPYQPPAGTQEVINNYMGSLMIAWTDALKLYSFNYGNNTWEILPYTLPSGTKQVLASDGANYTILKDDNSVWMFNDGTLTSFFDLTLPDPDNTVEILIASYVLAVKSDGSIQYFDHPSTETWIDYNESFLNNHLELIIYKSGADEGYHVRLANGELYNASTSTSLNITVPADTRSSAYSYSTDNTYVVLH